MGGSGGGQSGTVAYPGYIAAIQCNWMVGDQTYDVLNDIEILGSSMNEVLASAIGNSPFLGETAYDGATRISNWETEINVFETYVDGLSETSDWAALFTQAVTTIEANWNAYSLNAAADIASAWIDPSPGAPAAIATAWLDPSPAAAAEITADVDAFEAITDDRVENTVLPRFQRGMQDINAVMSSAFIIGQAIIEGMADRDVAKYQGELRTKAYLLKDQLVAEGKLGESNRIADAEIQDDIIVSVSKQGESDALAVAHTQDDKLNADNIRGQNIAFLQGVEHMVRYIGMILSSNEGLARLTLDSEFRAMEAERMEAENQLEIDEADAKWDISLFQYGANLLAASGGAAVLPPPKTGPTRTQATIGGAASGAAMGGTATAGNPWGIGIGAVVGAYLGYSSA